MMCMANISASTLSLTVAADGTPIYKVPDNTADDFTAGSADAPPVVASSLIIGNYTLQPVSQADGEVHLQVRLRHRGIWLTRCTLGTPPL